VTSLRERRFGELLRSALPLGPNGVTHLEFRVAVPKPEHKDFVDQAGAKFAENMDKAIEKLRQILEGEQPPIGLIDEPPLRLSNGRLRTEPVKSDAGR
jgi:hypothetical protein